MTADELTSIIETPTASAQERARAYVERGRLRWKSGDMSGALSDYNTAASLDPDGPGAQLAEHTVGILDFYNHVLYNP